MLLLLRCALDQSTLDEETAVALLHSPLGGADPFSERRLRQGLREHRAGRWRQAAHPASCWSRRCWTPRELAAARPALGPAGAGASPSLLATAREAAGRPAATAEDVLWAVWRASGLADRWAAASARGGRRGATADRDLDAVLVLFDAAARFTDRLPGARIEAFLDHLLDQQLPADTLAPTRRSRARRCGSSPPTRPRAWSGISSSSPACRRGSGRTCGCVAACSARSGWSTSPPAGAAGGSARHRSSALLDEERRLFYVATTRARRALLVTAVDPSTTGSGGEEQPSRFLSELAGAESAPTDPEPSTPALAEAPEPARQPATRRPRREDEPRQVCCGAR